VDAASGEVTAHASTEQAYTDEELRALLAECGYGAERFYPSLTGVEDETQAGLFALAARKRQSLAVPGLQAVPLGFRVVDASQAL
jgi:hypothetical protein